MEDRKNAENSMELGLDMMPEAQDHFQTANEYWQRFLKTGSVADYLNYAAFSREEQVPVELK
ncbi:MAG: hypothetical protein J6J42_00225 [Lachnospiraceae bacterium]|nr:hypothetical protein [Lachnospiraceae bacterium]